MSVSARVRAPVSYREWLALAKALFGEDWEYASRHYPWDIAFNHGWTPKQAVKDCRGWLYG